MGLFSGTANNKGNEERVNRGGIGIARPS